MPIDMSLAGSAPPRTRRATTQPARRQTTMDKRTEAVNGLFQLGQFGCIMAGQYADAAAIGMHGEKISSEVVNLASTNERIGKAVDYLNEVGPYAGLITAVMPLVLQLLANHKRIPADKVPGVADPSVLTAQMQASLAKQAAEQRREAERELAEARAYMAEASSNGESPLAPEGDPPVPEHV